MLGKYCFLSYLCPVKTLLNKSIGVMETKVYRRYVSVIKVHRDSEFLGYYTGRDKDNKVQYDNRLLNAMVIKTAKGVEHILHILNHYYSRENTFIPHDGEERFTTTYYDEYDEVNPKKVDTYYIIRLKKRTDQLSEPSYLSKFEKKDCSFESSLNFEKAIMVGEYHSERMLYQLTRKYSDEYELYKERMFIRKNRELVLCDA